MGMVVSRIESRSLGCPAFLMAVIPRSDKARLIDFVKLRGTVDGSRRSVGCQYAVYMRWALPVVGSSIKQEGVRYLVEAHKSRHRDPAERRTTRPATRLGRRPPRRSSAYDALQTRAYTAGMRCSTGGNSRGGDPGTSEVQIQTNQRRGQGKIGLAKV